MTIAYDAKRLFYNRTGLGNYSRALFTNFARRYPGNNYELFPFGKRSEAVDLPNQPDNTHYHWGGGALARQWGVTAKLDRLGVDIYHGLSNELPLNIHRARARSVVTVHDLIFRHYPETYPLVDRQLYAFKTRRACERADRIVAVSQSTKADIIAAYGTDPTKISVVPPVIHEAYFEPSVERTGDDVLATYGVPRDYILYVGTVERRKNLETALHAYAGISTKNRPPLVVVGKGGEYLRRCKQLANTLQLTRVHWLDYVAKAEDLHALYRLALFLLYPSRYEGFGMPVVEALLSNTPVLTSDSSALPEAAGPGGWLVDPESVEAIRHGMLALSQDAVLRTTLAEAGRRHAMANFAPEVLTDHLRLAYEYLM